MASVQEQIAASSRARRLSGGQIIAEYLTRAQVPYAVGIPGHGIWTVLDAFQDYRDRLQTLQVMHEQSAVH
ncbi:MAG TPA: thiamine pyrophosphate-binding protein, partial [Chloroflexota bacterium]|nr:thiamine pyrophosphate-binding protein [Chloroflexota bacterium]